jgi:hypothetical protein
VTFNEMQDFLKGWSDDDLIESVGQLSVGDVRKLMNNLNDQIATCRELREYDRKEIHRLRAEIELVSK